MKTLTLIQGSPEWHAHRAQSRNASDAPAMLGVSPYKSRTQLLREIATGIAPEADAATQRRFDDGHRAEAFARPLAEKIINEELYPCVGVLPGTKLSASFDGLTLLGDAAFEHKLLNNNLRELVWLDDGSHLPDHYRIQMEQQCLVSGAERVLFMASEWDANHGLIEERHCWYSPDPVVRARIIAGWEQFERDLAEYVPEPVAAPAPAGHAPETLPSLRVEAQGMVTFSNLSEFRDHAVAVLGNINRDLRTDDDFADAEQTVKWCKGVEDRLESAKANVLAQMTTVDDVCRTIDDVSAETRRIRLELDRLVKAEKENRKAEIVSRARTAYTDHEDELKAETKGVWIALPNPDFTGAIKGKRTLSSMQDAVDTVLANAKIAANEQAAHVRAALACLTEETAEHKHLFPDYLAFIAKPVDDIRDLVRGRIAEHHQREVERLEQERARIRKEEAERLEREQANAAKLTEPTPEASVPAPAQAPATPVRVAPVQPGARIKLGDINARIAPLSITADGLASLGFNPVGTDRAAKLYNAADLPSICLAMIDVINAAIAQNPQRKVG